MVLKSAIRYGPAKAFFCPLRFGEFPDSLIPCASEQMVPRQNAIQMQLYVTTHTNPIEGHLSLQELGLA